AAWIVVPVVSGETAYGTANADLIITPSGSDPNGRALTFRVHTLPQSGTLFQYSGGSRGALISASDTVLTDAAGRFIFAPDPNGYGYPYATLGLVASDGSADSLENVIPVWIRGPSPATLTVSSTGDDNQTTLRQVLLHSIAGD